ncbi:MAG: glycosyltransferase involved in cell wall biosynthesis [Halocynthiibacter sp.]|jgi:glycosyltransferase involved in cell wall biosynthesis
MGLRKKPVPYKLGLVAIMKNEGMNIEEWLSHYEWLGVDQIYLIDNGSTDDSVARAQPWIDKGFVRLVIRPKRYKQVRHYRYICKHFDIWSQVEWLMVADLDEFWFCKDGARLPDALDEYDNFDVIYANWTMFGSSGLVVHPNGIRENFAHRSAELFGHNETKWIARCSAAPHARMFGIHKVFGGESARTISDNRRFQLNHYPIQSEEYFRKVKMERGSPTTPSQNRFRDMAYFERYDAPCTEVETLLADRVRAAR